MGGIQRAPNGQKREKNKKSLSLLKSKKQKDATLINFLDGRGKKGTKE